MVYKKTYPSKYSPGTKISVAQYIAEQICENRAKNLKTELPTHFSQLPEWRSFYLVQLQKTYKLLETYHYKPVLETITNKNIFILGSQWIVDEIKKAHDKFMKEIETIETDHEIEVVEQPKIFNVDKFSKPSLSNKYD